MTIYRARHAPPRVSRSLLSGLLITGGALLAGSLVPVYAPAAHQAAAVSAPGIAPGRYPGAGVPEPHRAAQPLPAAPAQPATYITREGDSIASLSVKLCRSADWTRLYHANASVIGSDPWLLQPGEKLVLAC